MEIPTLVIEIKCQYTIGIFYVVMATIINFISLVLLVFVIWYKM